jgi:hypothetical protein
MKKIKIILSVFLAATSFAQQDAGFSMYFFNPVYVNPGYAGSREVISGTMVHRSQWAAMNGAPSTQTFSLHSAIPNSRIGLGFQLYNDNAGPMRNTGLNLSYAYHLPLSKESKLSFGVNLLNSFVLTVLFLASEETSNNNGNHRPLRITATGFKVLPASVLTTLFDTQLEEVHINFGAVYNSLFNRFYSYHTGQHIRKNRYIQSWTNLGYGFFVKNTEKFPLVIPGRNDSTALERIRIYGETTSLDGRYLFYLAMINGEYWLRLFRYDLTSPDSASFAQNAVEISFGTRILLNNTTDIQMAPDGNIYYPILEERVFNHPNNCKIGRIVNAGDPDSTKILLS